MTVIACKNVDGVRSLLGHVCFGLLLWSSTSAATRSAEMYISKYSTI